MISPQLAMNFSAIYRWPQHSMEKPSPGPPCIRYVMLGSYMIFRNVVIYPHPKTDHLTGPLWDPVPLGGGVLGAWKRPNSWSSQDAKQWPARNQPKKVRDTLPWFENPKKVAFWSCEHLPFWSCHMAGPSAMLQVCFALWSSTRDGGRGLCVVGGRKLLWTCGALSIPVIRWISKITSSA